MTSVPQTTPAANGATRPVPVSSFDWESGTYTYDVSQMDRHGIWRTCVATAATKAYSNLPESHSRIDKAIQLVLSEAVDLHADDTALVLSSDGTTRYHVNGVCECPDAVKAPRGYCKHRIARLLVIRAIDIAKGFGTEQTRVQIDPATVPALDTEAQPEPMPAKPKRQRKATAPVVEAAVAVAGEHTVPSQFVTMIKNRQAVLYVGLLHMSTQDGLISLSEELIHIEADLVIAKAIATFKDGRTFTGMGDATPKNVTPAIAPHFRRMACTRAKARALRDALNIGMVSFEEMLADE